VSLRRPGRPAPLGLDGAVALVTGGGRGIGLATAQRLLARGARVGLLDVDTAALDAAADEAAARWGAGRVLPVGCDVRDGDGIRAAVDAVVANAGVTPPPATLRVLDPAVMSRVIEINLLGVWHTVRAGLEQVIANRGHIAVTASCAAFTPGMGGSPYMISKAGVEQLGRALRIELAMHGATAGLVSFGIVETAMARATLDDDDLGRQVGELLRWPLNRRIGVGRAAEVICDSIERRQARRVEPRSWLPYAVLRGAVNPLLDDWLAGDRRVQALLRRVEQRVLAP